MVEHLKLPKQLLDYHFRIVKARGKRPDVEREWQTKNNYRVTQELAEMILKSGLNYGFTCPSGFCCFVDADTKEVQNLLDQNKLTFRYSSGTPAHYQYVYFVEEGIGCIPLKDGAYIKGKGGFTVGPGSLHPNGNTYGKDVRDVPIMIVRRDELLEILEPFLLKRRASGKSPLRLEEKEVTIDMIHRVAEDLRTLWANSDHYRHDLTMAIVGYLERRGWPKQDIERVIGNLVNITGKGSEHFSQVKYLHGKPGKKYGMPMIKAIEEAVENGNRF